MKEYDLIQEELKGVATGEIDLGQIYLLIWKNVTYLSIEQRFSILGQLKPFNHLNPMGPAWHLFTNGMCHTFGADFVKGIELGMASIEKFSELGDKEGMMATHMMLGTCYRSIGQLDKAQDELQASLDLIQHVKPGSLYGYFPGVTYYQCGELHLSLKNYPKAIDYFNTGISHSGVYPDILGRMINGLGNALMQTEEWENALAHYEKALETARGLDNFLLESKLHSDIAGYYLKKKDFGNARKYLDLSLDIRLRYKLLSPAITNYVQLAQLHLAQGDAEQALRSGQKALELAIQFHTIVKLPEVHHILFRIYEHMGNPALALEHFKKYHDYNEEFFNQEAIRKIEQVNTRHKVEMMQQEKEIFRLRNVELKSLLDDVRDSIYYAKRIQKAILPPDPVFKDCFAESFILYKPRDIVAGDFYWLETAGNQIIFAVCDCTGHGVPGAMVSVVCHNALNQALRESSELLPGKILDRTRELIIQKFGMGEDEVKDGMDCVLCMIDSDTLELRYAAANNAFYLIREGKLLVHSPDKMPVGKFIDTNKPFSSRSVQLQKGDMLYLFSDGFADQFGGPKGKKINSRRFEELLLQAGNLSPAQQKEKLENAFNTWKGNQEQVDDVLVIGIRF